MPTETEFHEEAAAEYDAAFDWYLQQSPEAALKFDAEVFTNDFAAGQDCNVIQHFLASIAKAGRLDCGHVNRATQFIDHQRCQSFAFNIFCDNQNRLTQFGDLFQDRQQVSHRRNFLLAYQNDWILEDGFHLFGVRDEVGRQIAAIKLHTFDKFQIRFHRLSIFDCYYAIFADFFHRLRNKFADGGVAICRDRTDLGNHVACDRL